ncbi:Glucan endo-1,3-beta-glucosidase A1 [Thalassocella blandensis]|nr:Glucan endo-1,3-beta-glucosidase A1 [Thalassocella blandensis]
MIIARERKLISTALILLGMSLFTAVAHAEWRLVWSDEFRTFDERNWKHQTGDGCQFNICGWGNAELQLYRPKNTQIVKADGANGKALKINLTREGGQIYSSRLVSQGKRTFKYGRIEARIKRDYGPGIWPAFWMLGTNGGTWPAIGEIDIMEQRNSENQNHGTIHWQGADGNYASYGGHIGVDGRGWHVYRLDWTRDYLRWFVDGQKFHEVYIGGNAGGTNEFNDWPFYMLINLAAGSAGSGFTAGQSAQNTALPKDMHVDWIRVWQQEGNVNHKCNGCAEDPLRRWEATNVAGAFIRHQDSRVKIGKNVNPLKDSRWQMVRGLTGEGVSFQSENFPGQYLRHRDGKVFIDVDDGSDLYAKDATFFRRAGLNGKGTSFESYNFRGSYLRHRDGKLFLNSHDGTNLFKNDASFYAR